MSEKLEYESFENESFRLAIKCVSIVTGVITMFLLFIVLFDINIGFSAFNEISPISIQRYFLYLFIVISAILITIYGILVIIPKIREKRCLKANFYEINDMIIENVNEIIVDVIKEGE